MKKNIGIESQQFSIEYPDLCPVCHHYGDIQQIGGGFIPNGRVEVLFRCPFPQCRRFFIGTFGPHPDRTPLGLAPTNPEPAPFAESVADLSPSFAEIFRQADIAKSHGLLQVAGPGYRKAFEFLIKDYAKSKNPDEATTIESAFSGQVVKDYIPDVRIQQMATRALWLGNDETHYLRKWEAHDMEDLVALIKLAVHWIEIERLSAQYADGMPDGA